MTLCPYCGKDFHHLGIMRHRQACRKKLHPSIDCQCSECKKMREFLKEKEKSGELNLVGLPEDLEKIKK